MLYIQLPKETQLQKDSVGFSFIVSLETLESIMLAQQVKLFSENGNDEVCSLAIFRQCPDKDETFIEYLPNDDPLKPATWVEPVNGIEKNKFIRKNTSTSTPWLCHTLLNERRATKIEEQRKEVKSDRYTKGPKSW